MADAVLGSWHQGALWEWPEGLIDLGSIFDTIGNLILSILEIAVTILEMIKAFLVAFIDPIEALIQLIIDEIEAFIRDLQQMGIYLTGDWGLMNYPFGDLLGGFQAFERRMTGRLTDYQDPLRPDVSPRTKVLGIFIYTSVDLTAIYELIRMVQQFISLFNVSLTAVPLPQCININAAYGAEGVQPYELDTLFNTLGNSGFTGEPPRVANIQWEISTPLPTPLGVTVPLPPPAGFLIEVSTLEGGLPFYFDRAAPSDPTKTEGSDDASVEGRQAGNVMDATGEQPFVLYGGADQLSFEPSAKLGWNDNVDSEGNLGDGARRYYSLYPGADPYPIPVDQLKADDGTYYLQRSWIHRVNAQNPTIPGQPYGITIPLDELPHKITIEESNGQVTLEDDGLPGVVYVRVSAIDQAIADGGDPGEDTFGYVYEFDGTELDNPTEPRVRLKASSGVMPQSKGPVSQPFTMAVPASTQTAEYLQSLATALAIAVLSRSDLDSIENDGDLSDEQKDWYTVGDSTSVACDNIERNFTAYPKAPNTAGEATNLESAKDMVARALAVDKPSQFFARDLSIPEGRRLIYEGCMALAQELLERSGPLAPSLEALVVENSENLRTFKWSDLNGQYEGASFPEATILESLYAEGDVGIDEKYGVCTNLRAIYAGDDLFYRGLFRNGGNDIFQGWSGEYLTYTQQAPLVRQQWPVPIEETERTIERLNREGATQQRRAAKLQQQLDDAIAGGCIDEDGQTWRPPRPNAENLRFTGDLYFATEDFPVLYSDRADITSAPVGGNIVTCRGALRAFEGGVLYTEASIVLNIATAADKRPADDTEWISFRWPGTLPPVERVLQTILNWVLSIKEGIKAVTDAIVAFIEFIQARIVELQNLIRRILALIQSILLLEIPEGNILFLLSDGTDGLTSDFIGAGNKPQDSIAAYGGGACVVIPTLPAMGFLIDLLFPEGGLTT